MPFGVVKGESGATRAPPERRIDARVVKKLKRTVLAVFMG